MIGQRQRLKSKSDSFYMVIQVLYVWSVRFEYFHHSGDEKEKLTSITEANSVLVPVFIC